MKKGKSFTLIELLVVIAIIGILASITAVALKGARERAQLAKTAQWARSVFAQLGADAVGIWNFNDCTATDLSAYGNNGTLYITSPGGCTDGIPGFTGKALYFDGNDYVNIVDGPSLRLEKNITVEVWIKPLANVTDWARIVGKGNSTYRNYGLWRESDGDILWQIYSAGGNGGCWNNGGAGDPLNAFVGSWMHVAATYDGSNMRVYSNGVLRRTCPYSQTPYTSSDPATIGYAGFHTYFNGLIDEVRIYSRALTAMEIQKHYVEGLEKYRIVLK